MGPLHRRGGQGLLRSLPEEVPQDDLLPAPAAGRGLALRLGRFRRPGHHGLRGRRGRGGSPHRQRDPRRAVGERPLCRGAGLDESAAGGDPGAGAAVAGGADARGARAGHDGRRGRRGPRRAPGALADGRRAPLPGEGLEPARPRRRLQSVDGDAFLGAEHAAALPRRRGRSRRLRVPRGGRRAAEPREGTRRRGGHGVPGRPEGRPPAGARARPAVAGVARAVL